LPPGAVPIFTGAGNDQLRAAIARPQKQAAADAAAEINGTLSQVSLAHLTDFICQLF